MFMSNTRNKSVIRVIFHALSLRFSKFYIFIYKCTGGGEKEQQNWIKFIYFFEWNINIIVFVISILFSTITYQTIIYFIFK